MTVDAINQYTIRVKRYLSTVSTISFIEVISKENKERARTHTRITPIRV